MAHMDPIQVIHACTGQTSMGLQFPSLEMGAKPKLKHGQYNYAELDKDAQPIGISETRPARCRY